MSKITLTTNIVPISDTSIDILSFDIGTINMGIAKMRYDFVTKRLCILNAMLMNIFNPFQTLNENDKEVDTQTKFTVDAYYASEPASVELDQGNKEFSTKQLQSRKRARVTEKTEKVLEFVTDTYPENTAKRRRKALEQPQITKSLANNWALIGAQLSCAFEAHKFINSLDEVDFIIIEQQQRTNVLTRAICMSIVTYYETKRQLQPQVNKRFRSSATEHALWTMGPFIKICSAVNKLSHDIVEAMHNDWIFEQPSCTKKLTATQIRALLKKHFIPPPVDTSSYSKRKISSKHEITKLFCNSLILKARSLSFQQSPTVPPEKCSEEIIEQLTEENVNNYAFWIVNQLGEKNNVTDALLQAFAWIQKL